MDNDKQNQTDSPSKPPQAPITNGSQGFTSVSQESLKFLQPQDTLASPSDNAPKQKFILTRDTLAKRPNEFGPTAQTPQKLITKDPPSKKHLALFIGAISALALAIIAIVVVINLPRSADPGDLEVTPDPPSTSIYSGSVTTRVGGKLVEYRGAHIVNGIDVVLDSGSYESANDDEAVFLVINGGSLTIDEGVTIAKTSSADFNGNGDDYDLYGWGSAIIVIGENSQAIVNGATITTASFGSSAIMAIDGGTAKVSQTTIETTGSDSRALHATLGGTITATNLSLQTSGTNSPLIYSAGNVTVADSTGTSTGAGIAVIKGENSITLQKCDLRTNGYGFLDSQNNSAITIYNPAQDVVSGASNFTASDSTLEVLTESDAYTETPFFLVKNANADLNLTDFVADFYVEEYFVIAEGTDLLGEVGADGSVVKITASRLNATSSALGSDSLSSISGLN